MRGDVIVRVQWADPGRSGLRTLRLDAPSLEEVCRHIATRYGRGAGVAAAKTNGAPRARVRKAAARPARAAVEPTVAEPGTERAAACRLVAGTIEWVGEVPAGHLLPPITLLRVRARDRRLVLRLAGAHAIQPGARVYLSGVDGGHRLFDAELVSGADTAPFFFEARSWAT